MNQSRAGTRLPAVLGRPTTSDFSSGGFTLPELMVAIAVLGLVVAIALPGLRQLRETIALGRAESACRSRLAQARMLAIARRGVVRIRTTAEGELTLEDPAGNVVSRTRLLDGPFRVDSVRLRPATLRYNSRGQAGPGSLYLYRGNRGVRIVSNFLGRLRIERFRLP